MKILGKREDKKERIEVWLTQEEFIQIWSSLLYNRATHKDCNMPVTEKLIKQMTQYMECPWWKI